MRHPDIKIVLTGCADYESIARIRCCAPILQCANEVGVRVFGGKYGLAQPFRACLRLSNTMDAEFCVAALEEAMNRYGVPEIFRMDQGSQFTSLEFIQALKGAGVAISIKRECLYLRKVETGSQAGKILRDWFQFYSEQRPPTAFDGHQTIEVYCERNLNLKAV